MIMKVGDKQKDKLIQPTAIWHLCFYQSSPVNVSLYLNIKELCTSQLNILYHISSDDHLTSKENSKMKDLQVRILYFILPPSLINANHFISPDVCAQPSCLQLFMDHLDSAFCHFM